MNIKVGDKFWVYDTNRRSYDENRRMIPGCHFYEVEVLSETSRSWCIGLYRESFKVPKKNPFPDHNPQIYTDQMKADHIWKGKHEYKIKDCFGIGKQITVDQLKQSAKIVGYEWEEK